MCMPNNIIHVCKQASAHTHIHTQAHTHAHTHTHIHCDTVTYINTHILYITYTCTHSLPTSPYTHTCTHSLSLLHTHTHTHAHRHMTHTCTHMAGFMVFMHWISHLQIEFKSHYVFDVFLGKVLALDTGTRKAFEEIAKLKLGKYRVRY